MDDNLNTSSLNQEVENRLDAEILFSSSGNSSNLEHDKVEGNCRVQENAVEFMNGVNEDENHSCGKNFSNDDISQECESQIDFVEKVSNEHLGRLNAENLKTINITSFSDHNGPGGNENSLSECTDPSGNVNSSLEVIDACGNENLSENINAVKNGSSGSECMDSTGNENSLSSEVDGSKNESSMCEFSHCDQDRLLSEHNSSLKKVEFEKKSEKEDRVDSSLQSELIAESQNGLIVDGTDNSACNGGNIFMDKHVQMEVGEASSNSDTDPDLIEKTTEPNEKNSSHMSPESSMGDRLNIELGHTSLYKNSNSETIFLSDTAVENETGEAKHQDNGEIDEIAEEEQEVVVRESGVSLPKIHLVTTLDDVFIDTAGSPVPTIDSPVANPLETDHEDTNDNDDLPVLEEGSGSKSTGPDVTDDVDDSANDVTLTTVGFGKKKKCHVKVCSENKIKNFKDQCEQEVITGDKTVSQEYVTKNLELLGDSSSLALNDHGYSKQGAPPVEGKDTWAKKSPKTLKVIYPKRKMVDVNQLDIHIMPVPVLKHCLHCAKLAKCCIRIEVGGCECHLCSEECLEQHKTLQSNTLRRTSIQPDNKEEDVTIEARLCAHCKADVSVQPEEKILSWETMEFCNEDCLGKYQAKTWTSCTGCSKDIPTTSMGKYCVRFGHEIKQFCISSCLEDFKKGIKACSYCQKDLSASDEGFLAPIADKNQFRDFCSQNCLDEYDCMSRNLPAGGLKVEACGVCDKTQLVQVQVVTTSGTVNLCSEVCFKAFKFVNKSISPIPCYMCKKYFETSSTNKVTVYYENEILTFCSKNCMNINILGKRRIVACNWCKVKKYNFDMIRRKSSNGIVTNWCSLNCMALYQVSMNAVSLRNKSNCAQCFKYGFPSLHLTMSDATIRNFCSQECVNKFKANYKGQSGNGVFPTGGPKKVVRTKALLPTNAEKNATFTDVVTKDATGYKLKTINTTFNAVSPVGSAVIHAKLDEVSSASTLNVPTAPQNVLTLQAINPEVKNAKVQVYCHKINKAVSAKPNQSTRSIQTDELEEKGPVLVPVPVPVYVPVPLAMYSVPVPTPFPFPVPIPVPIIIPTTRGTAEQILADIKKIQDKMPGNPFEAELLMMAEMAEGQKESSELEGNKSDDAVCEETRLGLKRGNDDIQSDDGPPEKKRREDTRKNVLDNAVHHLATSQLSMSLKETLGVSAWKHYASQSGERIDLLEMRPGELAQALKRFLQNARIPGEGEYTPDQKYYLMLGIQYYLEESGRIDNIFLDKLFDPFIDALNEEAKKFQETFANSDNVITRVEEEHLWESKQLGPHSPATLLATLIYFNTKYFNLTTVEEHMQLSFSHIMKHWKRSPSAAQPPSNTKPSNGSRNVLLRFYPPQSSLDAPNSKKKKIYEQEANETDPYRCPVQLYEFYLSKCPESMKSRNDMFYLNPERSCVPDSPIWYSTLPLDPGVLEYALNRFKMVKEINLALLSDL